MKKNWKSSSLVAAASVLVLAPAASAANGTWDTTVSGSSWNTNGNWVSNVIANGSGNTADFSTLNITADTTDVALDGARTIGNLTFSDTAPGTAASWRLTPGTGGALTLAGATPTITVSGLGTNKTATITAQIAGINGFTKTGANPLLITGSGSPLLNTISGQIIVAEGVLQLNANGLANAGANVRIDTGARLVLATASATAVGGTISFNGGTFVQSIGSAAGDYSNRFSTAANQTYRIELAGGTAVTFNTDLSSVGGALFKSGANPLTLAVANTFSGSTRVTGGNLILSNALALQNSAFDTTNSLAGTTTAGLVLNGVTTPTFGGLTGNKALATVFDTDSGNYGAVTNLTLNPGTGASYSYAAVIDDGAANMALTKTGEGTQILTVANNYTGGTSLSAGTLNFANASALGSGDVTFAANSTLQAGVATTLANNVIINSSVTGTLDTNGNNTTLGGALTGSGTLAKSGAGTLTLNGALNNTFSGEFQINEGILRSTNGTSFKNMTGAITVASGATFNFGQNFTGNNLTNALTLSGAGTGGYGALNLAYNAISSGAITLAADATISHDWNNATINGSITGANKNLTLDSTRAGQTPLTINGNISIGSGTLTKAGSNSVTLDGTNSYGSAVIDTGVLYFKQTAAMGGTGANITVHPNGVAALNGTNLNTIIARVDTGSNGAVAFGGTATTASTGIDLTNHPALSIGSMGTMAYSGTITPGGGNYRLGGGGGILTVTSALTGPNGLIIHDTQGGTVILTGTRNYTGPTVVNSGTLRVDGDLNGLVSVSSGGILAPGSATGIGSLNLSQPLSVDGSLRMRIDRAGAQKSDLLTAPSLILHGNLTVVNDGAALQLGDTFQLFSVSGSITRNGSTLTLPALNAGLSWNYSGLLVDGTLVVGPVTQNTIGDPNWPELLPAQLQAVRDAGYVSATITPGIYHLPDKFSYEASFQLSSWSNFTINADYVVFTVGKQRAFTLSNCSNITIKGLTIRARYPSFTQGRVLGKGNNPDGKAYAIWRISDGYPTTFATDETYVPSANEVRADFSINAVNGTNGIIDHVTGDNYNCILTPQGDSTWKVDYPNRLSLPFSVDDWLVTRLPGADAQSHAIFLNNSTNCTIESVTSQSGGFATFYEIGGGGNRLIGCRIECSPVIPPGGTELPVVSCSADGVHARDAYPGIQIDNLVTTGVLLDDCIAIHGFFHEVTAVSGNTITVSSLGKLTVGDPVRISHDGGYFAQATCTGILNVGGGNYNITLNQALPIPVGSRVCNPKYDGDGFQIINCQLSGTRSRAIITKADNGLISGCTIQHAGTAIKIGPEYYWNESGYCWNVIVENTVMTHCTLGVYVNADGAMGNKNIIVRNNTFGTMSQSYAIRLEGCDGATISGNHFGAPIAAETIRFEYSNDVTLANNLVAYSPAGMSLLRGTSNVTNLQGSANGLLYSGRAYALSNSLSGLLLANPFSNAAGDPAQQYTECNASGRWFLQPDGTGHAKIVSAANGLVLGVNDSSATGAPVVPEPSGAGDGQRWTLTPVGTSTIELVNKLSGLSATIQTTQSTETVSKVASASTAGQLWTPTFNDYTYDTWASASGAGPDPLGDDNQNGIINLLEYALAYDVATTESLTSGKVVSVDVDARTDDCLTLTFQRRVAATDIAFNVEYSTDLSVWQANSILVSSTPNPDGTTSETWRSPPITDAPSGFLRVRVEKTE